MARKRKTFGFDFGAIVIEYYLRPKASQNDVDQATPDTLFRCQRRFDKAWMYTELGRVALTRKDIAGLDKMFDINELEPEYAKNLRSY